MKIGLNREFNFADQTGFFTLIRLKLACGEFDQPHLFMLPVFKHLCVFL